MSRFFLSHAWADKEIVRRVAARLESAGGRVWLDERDIDLGENFVAAIDRGIRGCEYVLPFISAHSVNRPWVQYEIDRALKLQKKFRCSVIPILVGDAVVPEKLAHILRIDLRQDVESGLSKLVDLVTAVITKAIPVGEEHELIWSRRKFDGQTKTTGTTMLVTVSETGKHPPIFLAVLFRIFGDNPGAALARDALTSYLNTIFEKAAENKWDMSLTYERVVGWLTLVDALMLAFKKDHGAEADTIGAAVSVIQGVGNLCAMAHVGDAGAFASYPTGNGSERCYETAVDVGPPFRVQHRSLAYWQLIRAPIGFHYTPEWGELNPKSPVAKMVNLARAGAYAAIFSHEVPKQDMQRFLTHIWDDGALTATAERICSWQRPAISESICVIYRRTKPSQDREAP